MPRFQRGDWVKWVGGSYHDLQGIVIDTRESDSNIQPQRRHEVKVIWDGKGLGSLKQKSEGSWQRGSCLKVLSRVEQNDENEQSSSES
jgi:hypothetical protein